MGSYDDIISHLIDIKGDIGGLKKSYDGLKSMILLNSQGVRDNKKDIHNTDVMLAKFAGGISVVLILFNFILFKFFQ